MDLTQYEELDHSDVKFPDNSVHINLFSTFHLAMDSSVNFLWWNFNKRLTLLDIISSRCTIHGKGEDKKLYIYILTCF